MASALAKLLGRRVRALREARGWKAHELAERASMSERGIFYVEKGTQRDPSLATMIKLAEALDITIADLLGDERGDLSPTVESLVTAAARLPGDSVELLTSVAMKMGGATELDQAPTTRVLDSPARADTGAIDSDAVWALLTEDEKALALEVAGVRQALAERMPHLPLPGSVVDDDGDQQVRRRRPKRRRSG